jgi:hypothetical protein
MINKVIPLYEHNIKEKPCLSQQTKIFLPLWIIHTTFLFMDIMQYFMWNPNHVCSISTFNKVSWRLANYLLGTTPLMLFIPLVSNLKLAIIKVNRYKLLNDNNTNFLWDQIDNLITETPDLKVLMRASSNKALTIFLVISQKFS